MSPESEGVLRRVQLLTQVGVHVLVLADRQQETDLVALQNTCRWQICGSRWIIDKWGK